MLSEQELEKIYARFSSRMEKVNQDILKIMGEKIAEIGELHPDDLVNKAILKNATNISNDMTAIIKAYENAIQKNMTDMYDTLYEESKRIYEASEEYYKHKGIEYVAFEDNKEVQAIFQATTKETINNFLSISGTTSLGITKTVNGKVEFVEMQKYYQDLVDTAIFKVKSGTSDYNTEMKSIVKELGGSGVRTQYASGYTRRLDSAIRMNIIQGVNTLNIQMQEEVGKQFGADGVELSVHYPCAPDHIDIQGRQFSHEDYEKANNALDRQIGTLNCGHFPYQIVLKAKTPNYTDKELAKIKEDSNSTFDFEGNSYTMYEGTQLQRKIETEIRNQKDLLYLAKASNNDTVINEAKSKISALNSKYSQLSKTSGLRTQKERLSIDYN